MATDRVFLYRNARIIRTGILFSLPLAPGSLSVFDGARVFGSACDTGDTLRFL
jgi:hypothetical protein